MPGDRAGQEGLAGREPEPAGLVPARLKQPEGDQPPYQLRMQPGGAGEGLEVQAPPGQDRRLGERIGHRCLLGSKFDAAASCSNSRRSSADGRAGTMILASAYRSPGRPRGWGRPRPRSRNRLPVDVPAGTLSFASPPGVSMATDAPSAASHGASGRSTNRSRPSTRYRGCGAMRTMRYRSPGEAPSLPRPPCPANLIRWPSTTPAGMFTSRLRPSSVIRRRPPPYASSTVSSSSASWSAPGTGPQPRRPRPAKKPPSNSSRSMSPAEPDSNQTSGPAPVAEVPAPVRGLPAVRAPAARARAYTSGSTSGGIWRKSAPNWSYRRRVSRSDSTSYASEISLNRSSAAGALLSSGWALPASFRYACWISSRLALLGTPRGAY